MPDRRSSDRSATIPTAKNVYDLDSIQLIQMVVGDARPARASSAATRSRATSRASSSAPPPIPFGDPFEFRPLRLAKKVKAGANFIQTQLIYNIPRFADFMDEVRELGIHEEVYLLAGVGPLKSPGMAKYMHDEVPGLDVPNEFVDRMTAAADGIDKDDKKGAQRRLARRGDQDRHRARSARSAQIEGVAGVHIMAIEWEEAVRPIVEGAGLLPRPEPQPIPEAAPSPSAADRA